MSLKFTRDHEWLKLQDDGTAVVGITHHAQDALGDVVFVELPEVGRTFRQGEVAGVVESVKAAADVYAPVDGEVVSVNDALGDDPSQINASPMDAGWFFTIRPTQPEQLADLLDGTSYDDFLKTL
jgi:glycine cleavage system H protein